MLIIQKLQIRSLVVIHFILSLTRMQTVRPTTTLRPGLFRKPVYETEHLKEEVSIRWPAKFTLLLLVTQLLTHHLHAGDSTFVEGRLLNQNRKRLITFYTDDFVLGNQNTYVTETSTDGSFEIGFPIRHTQDVLVSFDDGTVKQLILSPNDRLLVRLGPTSVFRGKNALACQNLEAFSKTIDLKDYQTLEQAYGMEFDKYANFRDKVREKELAKFDSFCIKNNCSQTFREWYQKHSKVRFIVDVTNYGWKSQQSSKSSKWSPATPINYLEGRIDLYDTSYQISSLYRILINNLSWSKIRFGDPVALERYFKAKVGFLMDHRSELTQEETLTLNHIISSFSGEEEIDSVSREIYWRLLDRYDEEVKLKLSRYGFEMLVEEVSHVEDLNLRDLLLCKFAFGKIENGNDSDFAFQFVDEKIVNQTYRNILTEAYLFQEKKSQAIAPVEYKISSASREKSGQALLHDITTANKGKLIVLDFWATWCGPCRSDFITMKQLKPTLPNEIVYVYLCCQSSSKAECQKVIDKYEIDGQHYFLNERQYVELQQHFQIEGFPTYIVLDKNGVIHRNLVNPSNSKVFSLKILEIFGR